MQTPGQCGYLKTKQGLICVNTYMSGNNPSLNRTLQHGPNMTRTAKVTATLTFQQTVVTSLLESGLLVLFSCGRTITGEPSNFHSLAVESLDLKIKAVISC